MATQQLADLDFNSVSRIQNLPDAVSAQQPATFAQLNAAVEGLKSKNPARVLTTANVNLAAPGTTLDGQTMAADDRFVANGQTAGSEIGIYVFNGAAVPATRALDANTATELNNAVIAITSGTSAGSTFRQVNTIVTLGTDPVSFTSFGNSAPAASTSTAGLIAIATQGEVDAGTVNNKAVVPSTLASAANRKLKFVATFGDGSATQYDITHNLGTRDVTVEVYRNSTPWDTVRCDVSRPSVNAVRLNFAAAPTTSQFNVAIVG
jgi:hypothetical protein